MLKRAAPGAGSEGQGLVHQHSRPVRVRRWFRGRNVPQQEPQVHGAVGLDGDVMQLEGESRLPAGARDTGPGSLSLCLPICQMRMATVTSELMLCRGTPLIHGGSVPRPLLDTGSCG